MQAVRRFAATTGWLQFARNRRRNIGGGETPFSSRIPAGQFRCGDGDGAAGDRSINSERFEEDRQLGDQWARLHGGKHLKLAGKRREAVRSAPPPGDVSLSGVRTLETGKGLDFACLCDFPGRWWTTGLDRFSPLGTTRSARQSFNVLFGGAA
jgi:hypothetical protein